MVGFGPFDSFSEALIAACSQILSKPHSTVGYMQDRELALRVSSEYCAWLYYTPDDKYEMSMLTDQSDADDLVTRKRSCKLPSFVDDPRYLPGSIRYIFALHNHPFGSSLTWRDMRKIIELANTHEWVVDTREGKLPIAIIAFYSMSPDATPSCDGFYQYTPETRELSQWSHSPDGWQSKKIGTVTWLSTTKYRVDPE